MIQDNFHRIKKSITPKRGDKKFKKKNGVSLLNPALLIGFIVSRLGLVHSFSSFSKKSWSLYLKLQRFYPRFIVSRVSFISLVLVCCLKKVLEFIFKTPTLFLKIHRILVSYTNNNLIVKV